MEKLVGQSLGRYNLIKLRRRGNGAVFRLATSPCNAMSRSKSCTPTWPTNRLPRTVPPGSPHGCPVGPSRHRPGLRLRAGALAALHRDEAHPWCHLQDMLDDLKAEVFLSPKPSRRGRQRSRWTMLIIRESSTAT